ncbi:type II and III secretion system protein family protein [Massilia sp. PAMC28688]|uniref:type II and III secretion system protein family protein n=1 Tax=Massilia sp. PAMC28688 TaxID=2861283 RepID=UPI001C62A3AD|nr:type II and III secretion system protein family protein [Massilia sp. PAMC28688]QYF95032.1 type II and III secretion system protein family protein [Massilia sp. PAMC28688]
MNLHNKHASGLVLALACGAATAAPAPAVKPQLERADSGPRCTGEAARPGSMTLMMGKSHLMRLPEPVRHRSIGNSSVAQAMLVAPDTLYLLGVDVGTTNMIIQGKSGSCSIVEIQVMMDPAAIQAAMATALPDEKDIKVTSANETIVLTGTVADAFAVQRAGEIALAFVRETSRSLARKDDDSGTAARGGATTDKSAPPELRVINMLAVSAPQQVMLEVKIAEVSKTLLERLEGGVTWRFNSGSWATTLLANFLTGTTGGMVSNVKDNGNRVRADAQKTDGLVRILAEPNVMAVSGQEGSFLAGGRIFIPVAQDNNKVTLEEKEFGVGLRFTPTVLAGGRINLRVAPEVSEVSREGIGISAAGFAAGAVLPLITTRRASTTVQLYDGQSFAIGGLIKNNLVTSLKGLPGLGEMPVLGALFRSADYQHDRSELVFVVTVHLVKPLPPNYALPTDKVNAPTRAEFLLGGKHEGSGAPMAPAASRNPAAAPTQETPGGFEVK